MLPVSLTFAGALALLNMFLAYRVSRLRVASKILVGDGGHPLLVARMRAHSNFVEYTPFVLILMALIEYSGGGKQPLWGAGIVYLVARLSHAFGMDKNSTNALRAGGALLTWVVMIGLAVWAIWIAAHPPTIHYL
jgi:uncharacterized protein